MIYISRVRRRRPKRQLGLFSDFVQYNVRALLTYLVFITAMIQCNMKRKTICNKRNNVKKKKGSINYVEIQNDNIQKSERDKI